MSELASAADLQPSSPILAGIDTPLVGEAPLVGEPELAVPVMEIPGGFRVEEVAVLSLISRGNTAVQVARLLGPEFDLDRSDVHLHRDRMLDKLNTNSVANAVHRAIKREIIPVESKSDPTVLAGLRNHDAHTLRQYARGVSNQQLAQESGQPLGVLNAFHDRLLHRLGAWSRPHAVRRGHELGILR